MCVVGVCPSIFMNFKFIFTTNVDSEYFSRTSSGPQWSESSDRLPGEHVCKVMTKQLISFMVVVGHPLWKGW